MIQTLFQLAYDHHDLVIAFFGTSVVASWCEVEIDKLPKPAQNVIHFALLHWKAIAVDLGWLKA